MTDPFLIHAVLMMAAWLVLFPAGAAIARFCKVTARQDWPRVVDNQLWWWLHRIVQYAGVASALAGFVIAWRAIGGLDIGLPHVQAGLAILAVAALQVASSWVRGSKGGPTEAGADPGRPATWRGDHYDMTPRRRAFEGWHKTAGWLSILCAPVVVLLGLRLYGWPGTLCGLAVALVLLQAAAFVLLARTSRRVGTYQAIWGPDPLHPGNRHRQRRAAGGRPMRFTSRR